MSDESESTWPEHHEGPEAYERFDATVSALLAVLRSLVLRRERAWRKMVDANPNRRGPKRITEVAPDPLKFDN
jgi:hypothetical protein